MKNTDEFETIELAIDTARIILTKRKRFIHFNRDTKRAMDELNYAMNRLKKIKKNFE